MERLTEDQQDLAEEAVGRAKAIARRYARIFPEHEQDLESAANYGAVRAASTYIPEMNGVWDRWSGLCIRGEIKDFLDNSYHKRRTLWADEALEAVESEQQSIEIARSDAAMSFERLIALLPTKHRELCLKVYKEGMTAGQAGLALGYTANHGDKLHREAMGILREQLAA